MSRSGPSHPERTSMSSGGVGGWGGRGRAHRIRNSVGLYFGPDFGPINKWRSDLCFGHPTWTCLWLIFVSVVGYLLPRKVDVVRVGCRVYKRCRVTSRDAEAPRASPPSRHDSYRHTAVYSALLPHLPLLSAESKKLTQNSPLTHARYQERTTYLRVI